MLWNDIWRGKRKPTTRWNFFETDRNCTKTQASGTTIQRRAKGLAKYVHLSKVLLYRGSFPYILL